MSALTVGAWSLGTDNCGGGANVHAIVDGEGVVVAWTTRVVVGGKVVVSDEQAKAHARMISALPELLAVLNHVCDELQEDALGNIDYDLILGALKKAGAL